MLRSLPRFAQTVALCALVVGAVVACGPEEEVPDLNAEREAALETLRQQKQGLTALRESVAEMKEQLASEAEGVDLEALATEIEQKENEALAAADSLNQALAEFINADPPEVGAPLNAMQREAFDMKADEDVRIAEEYIREGGDYRRAIQIYEAALRLDPDNERLQQLMADAEDKRYVTKERFDQVKNGMTEDEVRDILGSVNLRNIRTFDDRGVTAWFYKKDVEAYPDVPEATAVWFREKGGRLVVYKLEWAIAS